MGSYSDAYYAFTRAYELNRSDPDLVRVADRARASLRGSDAGAGASRGARNPCARRPVGEAGQGLGGLSRSSTSTRRSRSATAMLAHTPIRPVGDGPQGPRACLACSAKTTPSTCSTSKSRRSRPTAAAWRFSPKSIEREDDWAKVAELAQRVRALAPGDQENLLLLIEAAFRSGNVELGRKASFRLLQPDADAATARLGARSVGRLLAVAAADCRCTTAGRRSSRTGRSGWPMPHSSAASAARPTRSASRRPRQHCRSKPKMPKPMRCLAMRCREAASLPAAKSRFDAVLAFDPGNATALRGRAELELAHRQCRRRRARRAKARHGPPQLRGRPLAACARLSQRQGTRRGWNGRCGRRFRISRRTSTSLQRFSRRRRATPTPSTSCNAEFARQRDSQLNRGLL